MEFDDLLKLMVEKGGSDLFITAGVGPSMKMKGKDLSNTQTPLIPHIFLNLHSTLIIDKKNTK